MCNNLEAGRGMAVGLVGYTYTFASARSKLLATGPMNDNSRSCGGVLQPPIQKRLQQLLMVCVLVIAPHKSSTLLSTLLKVLRKRCKGDPAERATNQATR